MPLGHPLSQIKRLGQPWHGVYSAGALTLDANGAIRGGWNNQGVPWDTHYINFGLPAVTTEAAEAAQGVEWKNDAILHGFNKYYTAKTYGAGSYAIGPGTWLYRTSDGTIYPLSVTGNSVAGGASACSFNVDTDGPWTSVLGAVGTDWQVVNQSPTGHKALLVIYGSETVSVSGNSFNRPRAVNSIIEFSVTGGSSSVRPTVSATVLFDSTTSSTQWDGVNGVDRDFETVLLAGYNLAGARQVVSFRYERRYVYNETPMTWPYAAHVHSTLTIQFRIKVNGVSVFDAPAYVFDEEHDQPYPWAPNGTPLNTVASEANAEWYDCYFVILSNCLAVLTKPAAGAKYIPVKVGYGRSLYGIVGSLVGTDFGTYQVAAYNPRDGRVATGPSSGFV